MVSDEDPALGPVDTPEPEVTEEPESKPSLEETADQEPPAAPTQPRRKRARRKRGK